MLGRRNEKNKNKASFIPRFVCTLKGVIFGADSQLVSALNLTKHCLIASPSVIEMDKWPASRLAAVRASPPLAGWHELRRFRT